MSEMLIEEVKSIESLSNVRLLVKFTNDTNIILPCIDNFNLKPKVIFQIIKRDNQVLEFLTCLSLRYGKLVPGSACCFFKKTGLRCDFYQYLSHEFEIEEEWQSWIKKFDVIRFIDGRGKDPLPISVNRKGSILPP
jgi:hypothetical protein